MHDAAEEILVEEGGAADKGDGGVVGDVGLADGYFHCGVRVWLVERVEVEWEG